MILEPESSELIRALRDTEDELAGQEREVVYVFRHDGTLAYRGVGERDAVFAPLNAMRGNVVVHNHPEGGSLSRRDVQVLLQSQAAQMRVVTDAWIYVLDLPPDTTWEDVQDLVTILMDEVFERHRDGILGGELTPEEAGRRRWHEIWTGMAEIRGWAYRRQPRTSS